MGPLPALAIVLILALGVLFGLGWSMWWTRGLTPSAQPRAITARGELAGDEQATIELFKAVSPSVVHVTNLSVQRDPFTLNEQAVPRGMGTGFIWDDNGFIVTNAHVVEGANRARVILADRSTYDSNQIWAYPDKDLAIIRINAPKSKLKPIQLGTSHDLQVGQKTLAIGNPFGLDQTLTTGIVSAAREGNRVGVGPAHPRCDSDQCRHQPRKLRWAAAGQRRPADRRQHRHRESVGDVCRHRLRHPGGGSEPDRAPADRSWPVGLAPRRRAGRGRPGSKPWVTWRF